MKISLDNLYNSLIRFSFLFIFLLLFLLTNVNCSNTIQLLTAKQLEKEVEKSNSLVVFFRE